MELDDLMQGIEPFPLTMQEPVSLTGQAAVDYEDKRHVLAEQGIENQYRQLQTLKPRVEKMLKLFDNSVLGGYSQEKDSRYEEELAGTCIPCFASLPKDFPLVVKLHWALLHVGESRSMSLDEICSEAVSSAGEEFEKFAYRLRRAFTYGIDSVEKDYEYHKQNPLGEMPENLREPELDDESSDWWLDLRQEKEEIRGKMNAIRLFYQTMVELIKRKS